MSRIEAREPRRWGVYDQHTREWVVAPTLIREREAWAALLAVDSLHPWELEVRAEAETKPDPVVAECPECDGNGDCDGCGRECLRCDGDGEVPWDDLTKWERDRLARLGRTPEAVTT